MSTNDSGYHDGENASLRALAYELKHPLIRIARQAELQDLNQLESIQKTAEQTLQLLDSFMLSAQAEYGQRALDLSPYNTGAVLYDVSVLLRNQAGQNLDIELDVRTHDMVMTHKLALVSILSSFGNSLLGMGNRHLILRSYKTKNGSIGVGIFSRLNIQKSDLKTALELKGQSHMPLAKLSSVSNVSLSIADSLSKSIGGSITVKKMGKMSGLVAELPKSEQLSLV